MNFFHKKNKDQWIALTVVFLFLVFLFTPSCDIEDPLSKKEFKTLVDTLYKREISAFNVELDSTCNAQMDSMIQHNKDSILKIRLEQIEKLIQKK